METILHFSCLPISASLQTVRDNRIWANIRSPCARNVSRYNDGGLNVDRQRTTGCPACCPDETLWGMVKLEEVNDDFNDRVFNLPRPGDVVDSYLRHFNIRSIVDIPTMPCEAIFMVESESHGPGTPRWRDQHDRTLLWWAQKRIASVIHPNYMTMYRK